MTGRPWALLVAAALTGAAVLGTAACTDPQPGRPMAGTSAGTSAGASAAAPAAAAAAEPGVPVRIDIPAIDVHAALVPLGLAADGTVEVPPLGSPDAGWYDGSPVPGDRGPAVVLGHVDSAATGPSVFHDLRDLRAGDTVEIHRADGRTVGFRVDDVRQYPKAAFPTAAVYGDIDHAGLRLITCGGAFDAGRHSYLDNVVVYASAVAEGVG